MCLCVCVFVCLCVCVRVLFVEADVWRRGITNRKDGCVRRADEFTKERPGGREAAEEAGRDRETKRDQKKRLGRTGREVGAVWERGWE